MTYAKTPEGRAKHAAQARAYKAKSPAERAERRAIKVVRVRMGRSHDQRNRAAVAALKGLPCMDCGGTFPSECMDFDHRPGEAKLFTISEQITKSMAALRAEIAKCDLVCSNCHRIRTRQRARAVLPR